MAKAHPSGRFLVAGEAQPLWNPRQVVVVRRAKEDPPGRDDQTSRSPHIFHQFVSVFKESLGPRKVHFDYGWMWQGLHFCLGSFISISNFASSVPLNNTTSVKWVDRPSKYTCAERKIRGAHHRSPLQVTILWLFTAQPVHDESLGDESDGAVGRVERGHNVAGVAVNLEHKQR